VDIGGWGGGGVGPLRPYPHQLYACTGYGRTGQRAGLLEHDEIDVVGQAEAVAGAEGLEVGDLPAEHARLGRRRARLPPIGARCSVPAATKARYEHAVVAAGMVVRTAGRYSIAAGTLTVMAADRRIMIFGGEAALPGEGTGSRIGRKTE
jgi:hypothetical protein